MICISVAKYWASRHTGETELGNKLEVADLPQQLSSQRLLLLDLSPSLPRPRVVHAGPATTAQVLLFSLVSPHRHSADDDQ